MRVDRTRHIDSSEPDASGMLDYYYEYDIYRFVEGAECLVARSYTDSPQEAHFLRWELGSQQRSLQRSDFARPVAFAAEAFLRSEGKIELKWLGEQGTYERLPARQA
ncbi:MAG: hypothetical protein IPG63_03790 [Xanthomonadales bacterium]|nr:hypothetical protein [Xanthomonadales bacterium]